MPDTSTVAKIPPELVNSIASNFANHWIFGLIAIGLFVIIILAIIFREKFSLTLPGGIKIGLGGSSNDKNSVKKPDTTASLQKSHINCPHAVDFKYLMSKTTLIVSKISEIKYKGCLSEQMKYVEEQFVNIRTLYQRLFLEKLREKRTDTDLQKEEDYPSEDYKFYQTIIKLMLHDMEKIIRGTFANNHLAKYSVEDYENYIDLKLNVIKGHETDFLDTMYIGDWVITRPEIFELHRRARVEGNESIQRIIRVIYQKAREIAIIKENEIDGLENELQEFYDDLVGEKR